MKFEELKQEYKDYYNDLLNLYEYEYVDEDHFKDNQNYGDIISMSLKVLLIDYVDHLEYAENFGDNNYDDRIKQAINTGLDLWPYQKHFIEAKQRHNNLWN